MLDTFPITVGTNAPAIKPASAPPPLRLSSVDRQGLPADCDAEADASTPATVAD